MNKVAFLAALWICSFGLPVFAQNPSQSNTASEKNTEFLKDRLFMDVFHTFWMDTPQETNILKKLQPGFNLGMLFDFKQNKKAPFSFGLGLGFTYYTQYSDALFKKGADGVLRMYVLPDSSFHHKMNYFSCNIPLEFRYRHLQSGFKASLGIRIGLIAEISERYRGDNIDDPTAPDWNYKIFNLPNKTKYHFDAYLRIGWKYFSLYYSYQLTPVFEKGLGPKMAPMSLGFTFTFF